MRNSSESDIFKRLNVSVFWFSFNCFYFNNLYNFVSNLLKVYPPPAILIIHLGSEFIGKIKTLRLIGDLKHELLNIDVF